MCSIVISVLFGPGVVRVRSKAVDGDNTADRQSHNKFVLGCCSYSITVFPSLPSELVVGSRSFFSPVSSSVTGRTYGRGKRSKKVRLGDGVEYYDRSAMCSACACACCRQMILNLNLPLSTLIQYDLRAKNMSAAAMQTSISAAIGEAEYECKVPAQAA